MPPSFEISVDSIASVVSIRMSRFFKVGDIACFEVALEREDRHLGCGPNNHCTLVDMREMTFQSQASVAAFAKLLANASYASRRIAFVVEVGLAHAQVRRAAKGRNARFFQCFEQAEAWLCHPSIVAFSTDRGFPAYLLDSIR